MKRFVLLTVCALLALSAPARAAVLWSETSSRGVPTTHWAKGATIEEVSNLMRAYVKGDSRTIVMCRQPGWFAFVGSARDLRNGVVCGYTTQRAAVYAARQRCELQDGICDVERAAFDNGASTTGQPPSTLPVTLPGAMSPGEPLGPLNDPVEYTDSRLSDYLFDGIFGNDY